MSESIDAMQSQANSQNRTPQGADTVMDSSIQTKDKASQRLQQMANQVTEKTSPIMNQATEQAQRQARMVREKYQELQDRTGVEVTPQMLVVAAGVLAGVIALIAIIGRLVGRSDEEDEVLPVADITVNALPNGKYMLTRVED